MNVIRVNMYIYTIYKEQVHEYRINNMSVAVHFPSNVEIVKTVIKYLH